MLVLALFHYQTVLPAVFLCQPLRVFYFMQLLMPMTYLPETGT